MYIDGSKKECEKDSNSYENCSSLNGSISQDYKDVSSTHWASEAIYAIKSFKIMEGYMDGTFSPESKLTRAQAVKVLNRLFRRGPLFGDIEATFIDVPKNHWAFREIEEAARTQIYTLTPYGKEFHLSDDLE